MATVNYLYRSSKNQAPLTIRLLFSVSLDEPIERTRYGKTILVDYEEKTISAKTQRIIKKEYWDNDHKKQRILDIDRANYQTEIKQHLRELETYILQAFYNENENRINKDWLVSVVDSFYNPGKEIEAPDKLIPFFDFYLEIKKADLTKSRKQKINVVKRRLQRYEKAQNIELYVSDMNDVFKNDYTEFSDYKQYARTTLKSDFSIIKTLCRYAEQWNIEVSPQYKNLKVKTERIKAPYLSFDELDKIKNLDLPKNGYLDNARDWLIISCYTGQRVSDFLNFDTDNIIKKGNDYLLQFKQQKTDKLITIPFLPEAVKIIEKRNGKFPRNISDQKYNEYIKEVCKKAGLNEIMKGKKLTCIIDNPNKAGRNDYRKVTGMYKKYELVTSHIGRRSFATNYYGKVPTSILISITGHSTEKMFLKYIHKSEAETAQDALKYFK